MQIRELLINEVNEILSIWKSDQTIDLNDYDDSNEQIANFIKRNNSLCLGAFNEEAELAGCCLASEDGRRGYIYHTAVHPNYRKQGIGKALVDAALDSLLKLGINKVALVVFERNNAGNEFWEKMGFTSRNDLIYRNKALVKIERIDT